MGSMDRESTRVGKGLSPHSESSVQDPARRMRHSQELHFWLVAPGRRRSQRSRIRIGQVHASRQVWPKTLHDTAGVWGSPPFYRGKWRTERPSDSAKATECISVRIRTVGIPGSQPCAQTTPLSIDRAPPIPAQADRRVGNPGKVANTSSPLGPA